MSQADRIADMNTTAGFLIPVGFRSDPLDGSDEIIELSPHDLALTQQGYACPRCLCDYGGFYRITCPMCLHVRDVERDFVDAPPMWAAHREARKVVEKTRRPSIDDAIARVMRDPDVDHATTKQLMPSRAWGRGRPK